MERNLLRHLTRPIRSPIGTRHRCFRNGLKTTFQRRTIDHRYFALFDDIVLK